MNNVYSWISYTDLKFHLKINTSKKKGEYE